MEWLILMVVYDKFQMHPVMPTLKRVNLTVTMFTMKQCCIYFIFNIMRNYLYFSKQLEKSSSIDLTNEIN